MANNCLYEMRVVGKKENVEEFVKILKYEVKDHWLSRIFSAYDENWENLKDGRVVCSIYGDCAWSVHSCMFSGYGSYFGDGADLKDGQSTAGIESKRLGLEIEIYSTEPGIGFAEHYLIKNGEVLINDETDYAEYWYEPSEWDSFEEFKKEYGLPDDVEEDDIVDGTYYEGGYDVYFQADSYERA